MGSEVKKIRWSAALSIANMLGHKCAKPGYGTLTATPEAMAHAQRLFQSEGRMQDDKVVKMVFILTDGEITQRGPYGLTLGDKRDALAVAKDLNKMGVQTYSIGVGKPSDAKMKEDLLKIAAGNSSHRFMVNKFEELKSKVLGTIQNAMNCDV